MRTATLTYQIGINEDDLEHFDHLDDDGMRELLLEMLAGETDKNLMLLIEVTKPLNPMHLREEG